jgi:hypothetical protein
VAASITVSIAGVYTGEAKMALYSFKRSLAEVKDRATH